MNIKMLFMIFLTSSVSFAAKTSEIPEVRKKIGPVYAPPIEYKGSIYFLASSGALYKSDPDQVKVSEVFKTKLKSVTELLLDGSVIYFGDGVHENNRSNFYAFDLEKKKLLYSHALEGHLEKKPLLHRNLVITSLGAGGIAAFNKATGKLAWKVTKIESNNLHVDSTPVLHEGRLYFGSIYDYKAIISLQAENGKLLWKYETSKSPKSDLVLADNKIISIASDGALNSQDREIPSELIVLNLKDGKLLHKKDLRGSNYFPQLIHNDQIFISLSTGDLISVDLKNYKLLVIDQYPEPFLSSTFKLGDSICAISVMGRLFCYKNGKISRQENLGTINLGKVSGAIQNRVYAPSNVGFSVLHF